MRALRVTQVITTLGRGGAQATVLAAATPYRLDELSDPAAPAVGSEGPWPQLEVGDWTPIEMTVMAGPDDPGEGTHWDDPGLDGVRLELVPTLHRAPHPVHDPLALAALIRRLRAARPDVVHTHSAKAGVLGRLAARAVGVPCVHTVHGWGQAGDVDRSASSIRRRGLFATERALAPLSRALVVVTPLDAELGLAHDVGRADQYRVIRSGIDLEAPRHARLVRDELRSRLGLGRRFVVGTVARLAPQKDLSTLLDGFAQARLGPGAMLLIIGDGPCRRRLQAEADRLGLGSRVRFLGTQPDAARLVAAFDVFALTSRWEGLPRSLVEAMAADVPVVATPVGGVPELVTEGETGHLVEVGSSTAVARALETVAADPAAARVQAERAASSVIHFDQAEMRRRLAQLWFDAAGRPVPQLSPSR